jgi:hypothetical protein
MRAAFTAQALATIGADSEWDARLADYLRCDALQFADSEFGAYAAANEKLTLAAIQLEARYGDAYRSSPQAKVLADIAHAENAEANQRWSDTYLKPFWRAARDLASTPAPTLAAALFKVALIHSEEVWNDAKFAGNAMQIVSEDFARLQGAAQ